MSQPSTATRRLFRAAALFTLLAVVMGSVVCATDSGFECSTWPGCYPDRFAPGSDDVTAWLYRNPIIEFVHRTSAIVCGPLVLAAAVVAARMRGASRLVRVLPWLAVIGALAAGAFGRATVLGGIPVWAGAIDLFCALMAMAAMCTATVALEREPARRRPTPAGAYAWLSVGVLVVMHLLGLFVAGAHSFTRCMSWPVWQLVVGDLSPALQIVRITLAVAAAGAIVASVRAALPVTSLRGNAIASAALLAAVLSVGMIILVTHQLTGFGMLYSVLTVGVLFSQVLLGARADIAASCAPDATRASHPIAV